MADGLFLTGTDTEIGKTLVACALLEAWKLRGLRAVGFKPVAAGATEEGGRLVNEDARLLHASSSSGFSLDDINPVCLRQAMAPHLAATEQGIRIDPRALVRACEALRARSDRVVVEGVGGFRVPLAAAYDTADLAVALGLPVILVVGLRLGCINHALLTVDAIATRGLNLCGWIGNIVDPAMNALEGNIRTLQEWIRSPCLGIVPHMPVPDPALAARTLTLPF